VVRGHDGSTEGLKPRSAATASYSGVGAMRIFACKSSRNSGWPEDVGAEPAAPSTRRTSPSPWEGGEEYNGQHRRARATVLTTLDHLRAIYVRT